jgi:trimethylamine-N-oxide reductase (cytochrome c)
MMKMMTAFSLYAGAGVPDLFAESGTEVISHGTHFGALEAYVKDGKILKIDPHHAIGKSTKMFESLMDYVYSPTRIKQPCVRKSFLEGKKRPDLRGAEEFVSVSWDYALDLVVDKLQETKEKFGNESILSTSINNWSTAGNINRPSTLQGRFLGLFGGFTDTVGDYSAGATRQMIPYVTGGLDIYKRKTAFEVLKKKSKTIVLWAMDPLKNCSIDYAVYDHRKTDWYYELKKAGINFICVDPVYNDTAKELGAEWYPVKPSTDTAMIIGMCGHLYHSGRYNKDFIERYTVGFENYKNYLTGECDGVKKDLKWAEKICGVSVDDMLKLIDVLLRDDTIITSFYGAQRHEYGEQFHWSLMVLSCMLGNIGKPGGGVMVGPGWNATSGKGMPRRISQGRNPARVIIPASRLGEVLLNPGRTIDFNGTKITYPNVNLLHCSGGNAITHHQDTNMLLKGGSIIWRLL